MLFDSLDKLKRNSILSAILLIFLGAVIIICPLSIILILNFLSSKKSLMDYVKFIGSLILGIVGLAVLLYRNDVMRVLAWLFAFLLILDGARTMFHAFTYARRSQRKGWWVLAILSGVLIVTGIVLFINPFWNTSDTLMKAIGCAVFFSAIVSGIRLIWTWPLRKSKGGNEDGE